MTTEPKSVNWDLFRSKLENIKPYNGDVNTLNRFVKRCEDLVINYKKLNDNDLNQHVFECIQEKLIDKAEIMVGRRVELDNWPKLKFALFQCFSDKRDIDCLVQELTRTRPYKSEHLLAFGGRLQVLRSNVIQRISNDTSLDEPQKTCQINHYDKTALNTFIAGCDSTLRNNMYIKKPSSLEDAMNIVNEFENFEKLYNNNFENKQNQKLNAPAHKPNFNSNQYQNTQTQFYQNNPNTRFYQKPVWSSQPVNIQPRQLPPQKYPTNRQVFGPPQNIFRPNQINPNHLPKPTPMSTTSRNPSGATYRNQNFQRQNYAQPQNQKPNFSFEELYSNEYDEDTSLNAAAPFTDTYYSDEGQQYVQYYQSKENFDKTEQSECTNECADDTEQNESGNFREIGQENQLA